MPELVIPCTDCSEKTREIEQDGIYKVMSCEPIDGQEGWCKVVYELDQREG